MNTRRTKRYVWSGGLWIGTAVIFWVSWKRDVALPGIQWRLLMPAVLVMREIWLSRKQLSALPLLAVRWGSLSADRDEHKLPLWYPLVLINRIAVFPFLVAIYLLYILVQQSDIRGWKYSTLFLALDGSWLLTLMIASGIATCVARGRDMHYTYKVRRASLYRIYMAVLLCVSVVGGYIMLDHVLQWGIVGILVANVASILLFLVGMVLLDEEEMAEGTALF